MGQSVKIATFIAKLLSLYSYAIIFRVLLSWFNRPSYYNNNQERPVYDLLCRITDPYMNFFRSRKLTMGNIDYSPLFAVMVLSIVKSILQIFGIYGHISLALILVIIIQNVWSYLFSYIFMLLVILLAVRWFAGKKPYDERSRTIVMTLDRIIEKPVNLVFRLFYKNKTVSDQNLVFYSLLFYLAVYLGARYGFRALTDYLLKLQ